MHEPLPWTTERLITRALRDGSIGSYRLHSYHIEVDLDGTPIHVPYAHAGAFLLGLLSDRMPAARPPGEGLPPGDSLPAPVTLSVSLPVPRGRLEDLLHGACGLGLIDGYGPSAAGQDIVLHLAACSCPMTEPDAVAFLSALIAEVLQEQRMPSGVCPRP